MIPSPPFSKIPVFHIKDPYSEFSRVQICMFNWLRGIFGPLEVLRKKISKKKIFLGEIDLQKFSSRPVGLSGLLNFLQKMSIKIENICFGKTDFFQKKILANRNKNPDRVYA